MSYKVFSPLIKTSVLCVFISPLPPNSWQPLIFLLSPLFCLFQNGIQLESIFLFSLKTIRPLMAHPCMDQTGSRWQTPPLNTVGFLPVLSPVPLVLPGSHVKVQRDTYWVFVHRQATSFVPLVTVNPSSCWVCCKQTSHFFRPLL